MPTTVNIIAAISQIQLRNVRNELCTVLNENPKEAPQKLKTEQKMFQLLETMLLQLSNFLPNSQGTKNTAFASPEFYKINNLPEMKQDWCPLFIQLFGFVQDFGEL